VDIELGEIDCAAWFFADVTPIAHCLEPVDWLTAIQSMPPLRFWLFNTQWPSA